MTSDVLQLYLEEIGKIPLLTDSEVIELAWRLEDGDPDVRQGLVNANLLGGNQWWCRDTSLPRIQERSVGLWAQLFGVPVAASQNR